METPARGARDQVLGGSRAVAGDQQVPPERGRDLVDRGGQGLESVETVLLPTRSVRRVSARQVSYDNSFRIGYARVSARVQDLWVPETRCAGVELGFCRSGVPVARAEEPTDMARRLGGCPELRNC